MADEATIPPTEEAISGQVEGSVETLENANQEVEQTPKLVPEHDLLAVKDKAERKDRELKEAKARIAELEAQSKPGDLDSIKAKYSSVDPDFIEDIAAIARKQAEQELAPVRKLQSQESFEKRWNALYTDQLAKAEWVDKTRVNPDVIKTLALAPQNRWRRVKDIIEEIYPLESSGKATTENDMRPATEIVTDVIDTKWPIPKEKLERIFSDKKATKEFLAKKYS